MSDDGPVGEVERCGACRFWLDDGGDPRMGLCRRYPRTSLAYMDTPYVDGSGMPEPVYAHRFPVHAESDWCGEYKAKAPETRAFQGGMCSLDEARKIAGTDDDSRHAAP